MKITCDCKHTRKMSELEPFQGNIKSMTPKERAKLIHLLETYGLRFPFFVWGNKILNGHQRYDVLVNDFKYEGLVPVVEIEAETEKEAIELVLVSASQSGRFNIEELQEFTVNVSDLQNFSLVDGPTISLEIKADVKSSNPDESLVDNITLADPADYVQAETEEIETEVGEEIDFPDGSKFIVGKDVMFAREIVRHWNGRNRSNQIQFPKSKK